MIIELVKSNNKLIKYKIKKIQIKNSKILI